MKRATLLFLLTLLFLSGCTLLEVSPITPAATGDDYYNDVTWLNGSYFTTNRNAMSDRYNDSFLYRLDMTGAAEARFELGMSDQGYFSVATDGELLYMTGQPFSLLVVNTLGERVAWRFSYPDFNEWDAAAMLYQPLTDSLYFITQRHSAHSTNFRMYRFNGSDLDLELAHEASMDALIDLIAIEANSSGHILHGVAVDGQNNRVLVEFGGWMGSGTAQLAPDPLTSGVCRDADGWKLITDDRRLITWTP